MPKPERSAQPENAPPNSGKERPVLVITSPRGISSIDVKALWDYRELFYFLVWRDLKSRYRQTVLGVTWAVLQPLATMVVFSLIFGRLARLPSEGVPYPIFTMAALLPWNLFAGALGRTGTSVVGSAGLITKVYFPRLVVPISAGLMGIVDFALAFVILLGMMLAYGIPLTARVLTLPLFLAMALGTALGVGLWLSALNVRYRDVGFVVPFLTQTWLYLSPVAYSSTLVPAQWRLIYGLNPMAGVVEGFRWALLGTAGPAPVLVAGSVLVVVALLLSGAFFFRYAEQHFADIL